MDWTPTSYPYCTRVCQAEFLNKLGLTSLNVSRFANPNSVVINCSEEVSYGTIAKLKEELSNEDQVVRKPREGRTIAGDSFGAQRAASWVAVMLRLANYEILSTMGVFFENRMKATTSLASNNSFEPGTAAQNLKLLRIYLSYHNREKDPPTACRQTRLLAWRFADMIRKCHDHCATAGTSFATNRENIREKVSRALVSDLSSNRQLSFFLCRRIDRTTTA